MVLTERMVQESADGSAEMQKVSVFVAAQKKRTKAEASLWKRRKTQIPELRRRYFQKAHGVLLTAYLLGYLVNNYALWHCYGTFPEFLSHCDIS